MKTFFCYTSILIFLVSICYAEYSFVVKYEKVKATGDDQQIQSFLKASEKDNEDNPDYYIISANYWWALSQRVLISAKPPEDDDLSLTNTQTGKIAGSISQTGKAYPEIPQKALDILTKGSRIFPYRADILLGLATIQREMGKYDDCIYTLEKLLKSAQLKPESITWERGSKLPKSTSEFIPEIIQEYNTYFYNRANDEDDKRCERLCKSTIQSFPNHPYAYNILASLASVNKQHNEALEYLLKAYKIAPNDPIILLNLGEIYLVLGQKQRAKKFYKKVLNSNYNDDYKKTAKEKLILVNE